MRRTTSFSFRRLLAEFRLHITAAVLLVLPLNWACTRSNANAGEPRRTSSQTSQASQQVSQATSPQPREAPLAAGLGPEVAVIYRNAQAGDADAMYRLGQIYATGSAAQKDYKEALRWYQKSAAKGNADAMYRLGEAYERGNGVREDIQQAVHWYDEATLRGNKSAKAALDRLGESFDR